MPDPGDHCVIGGSATPVNLPFDTSREVFAGVDEVGRGCLAGPVVAAAVILDRRRVIAGVRDSKTMSPAKRLSVSEEIKSKAKAWAIARAEVDEIDKLNILQASLLAMKRAIEKLPLAPAWIVVDGQFCPDVSMRKVALIRGDSLIREISAASIIAKVYRDREMITLAQAYPGYGFSSNKGYATKRHIDSLKKHGVTDIHRRSFSPVNKLL